ncbi:MAG: hypothetical protein AB8B91_10400 [Rubripirellula sp.]
MKARRSILLVASIALISGLAVANAQEPEKMPEEGIDRIGLFDSLEKPTVQFSDNVSTSQSDTRKSKMTVAELRQARALYQADQRRARLEYNAWMGYEPLRPRWNSLPMTSSRYSSRRRIYVPAYVYHR